MMTMMATHTSDVDVWSAKFIHFVIITAYQVPLLPQGLLENRDAYVRWSENKLYLALVENLFSEKISEVFNQIVSALFLFC